MEFIEVRLSRKSADGFVIPLGPANLVAVKTDVGMVGCGAFDVAALDSFSLSCGKSQAGPRAVHRRHRRYPHGDCQGSEPLGNGARYQNRHDRQGSAGTALISFPEPCISLHLFWYLLRFLAFR